MAGTLRIATDKAAVAADCIAHGMAWGLEKYGEGAHRRLMAADPSKLDIANSNCCFLPLLSGKRWDSAINDVPRDQRHLAGRGFSASGWGGFTHMDFPLLTAAGQAAIIAYQEQHRAA